MKSDIFLIVITMLLTGCLSVGSLRTDDAVLTVKETDSKNIEIYATKKVGKAYIVLGEVVVSADSERNANVSVNLLKKEAAKLGADAIIDLRLEYGAGYWTVAIISKGTAVKFIN